MKQPKNKFIAVCIYFAPYIIAVACIVLYACLVNLFRNIACGWMLIEQDLWSNLLTYLPIAVVFLIIAVMVSKKIREKVDLSIIGITAEQKSEKRNVFSFLVIAICLVCVVVSVGFASSYSYLKVKKVGNSNSYYVTETGFMGLGKTDTVISSQVNMEFDGSKYVINLKNGKKYTINKDTNAGKKMEELFF